MSALGDEDGPGTSSSQPNSVFTQDDEYYFGGWFVTFEVEGRLFRVPSHQFFNESPDFVDLYKLSLRGMDSDDPIKLEEIRQDDFRNLLKALYPLSVSLQLSMSKDEWISVLTLSSEWRFLRLRGMAISELERLESLTSIEKICLGRDLHISSWVVAGYVELVKRGDPITDEEAIDIDTGYITTVYKLFRIRELWLAKRISSATSTVDTIFKDQLDHIFEEEQTLKELSKKDEAKLLVEEEERLKFVDERRKEEEEEEKRLMAEEMLQESMKREEDGRQRAEEERRSVLNMQLEESGGGSGKMKMKMKKKR
ncbi:hypothetical protein GALMADRAFT_268084 [Galerina marginata CBS 339.88]|uniref:BTB domain-containing protein n=1 Tax=Galerina marginata (strain CBS 339.88) TaxID=685588 RepID=A0A067T6I2_GALM3|nr:hypothetical protein GALMADRAFT_268084 [Galerina marginata CBS 339.88]